MQSLVLWERLLLTVSISPSNRVRARLSISIFLSSPVHHLPKAKKMDHELCCYWESGPWLNPLFFSRARSKWSSSLIHPQTTTAATSLLRKRPSLLRSLALSQHFPLHQFVIVNGGGRKSDLLLLPLLSVDDLFSCVGPFLVDEMEVRNLAFVIRRLGGSGWWWRHTRRRLR